MYILNGSKVLYDYDMMLLEEILDFIDSRIDSLSAQAIEGQEADSWLFNRMENLTGLGFTACQTYLTSTFSCASVQKGKALLFGPVLSEKLTEVQLINHAANFWKHSEEWSIKGNPGPKQSLIKGLEEIHYDVKSEYPISGCLAELTNGRVRFKDVTEILLEWRDNLISDIVEPDNQNMNQLLDGGNMKVSDAGYHDS